MDHIKRRKDYQDPFGPMEMSLVKRTAAASHRGTVSKKLTEAQVKKLEDLFHLRGTDTGERAIQQANQLFSPECN